MSLIQRFLLGNRVDDDLQVGLFLKNDGTVWLRNPDGSETQVGGGGSGSLVHDYVFLTGTVTDVAQFATEPFSFVVGKGTAGLINLTDPTVPTVARAGIWIASGYVVDVTGTQTGGAVARFYLRENSADFAGAENTLPLGLASLTNLVASSFMDVGDEVLGTILNPATDPNSFLMGMFLQYLTVG